MQLIRGDMIKDEKIRTTLANLEIVFPHTFFCSVLVKIDNYIEDNMDSSFDNNPSLIKVIVKENFNQKLKQNVLLADHYIIDTNIDELIIVFNLANDDNKIFQNVYSDLDVCKRSLIELHSIFITIFIGNIYADIVGIHESFVDSKRLVDYRLFMPQGNIITPDYIPLSGKYYNYPTRIEKRFMNSLRVGDQAQAIKVLNQVFRKNFIQQDLEFDMGKYLFLEIMASVIKVLNDMNIDRVDVLEQDLNPTKDLIVCSEINQMYYIIESVVESVCKYIADNIESSENELKEIITEYVHANYTSNNISLTIIADACNITPTYLSYFFKQHTNQNISDYINNLRISDTKHLLKKTTLTLEEISSKVGYTNSSVLIRNFKKYVGITPGQYRRKPRQGEMQSY